MTHPFALHGIWRARRLIIAATFLAAALTPRPAAALERFCDPAFEDCRQPLIDLIDRETVGIDVGFWFMEDARFSSALLRAAGRGVPIRVLMDTRANVDYPGNIFCLAQIQSAGIPMREKIDGGILHWKMMLFVGQRTVEFSGGNFSAEAFVPQTAWSAYVDEVIYFTDRTSYVNSYLTKFDDVWTSPTGYRNYANVTTVARKYATFPIDPELNFPPIDAFRARSVAQYNLEPQRIDVSMYRITDRAHSDAMIAAVQRGVQVRLITEQLQYRDESRLWDAWNVDRMWLAGQQNPIGGLPGIHVRLRGHDGLSHEKLTILEGLGEVIFGSSNWTSPSSDDQLEHNLFTTSTTFYGWAKTHFDRKWDNLAPSKETSPFVPLPPDVPQIVSPAAGATNQPASGVTFSWSAGPWAHKYDLYLGTSPATLTKVLDDFELGPYTPTWTVQNLQPATVYYWRVVSKTMANLARTSQICSFKTSGAGGGTVSTACLSGGANPPDPVLTQEPQDISPNSGSVTGNGAGASGGGAPGTPPSRTPSAGGTFTGLTAVPRP
jgi:phosphatidylserine/phosphatidylglycerophosphate/cardiolipin synthase-like enzyme